MIYPIKLIQIRICLLLNPKRNFCSANLKVSFAGAWFAAKKMEFPPFSNPFRGRAVNMRNEPLHDMVYVVKCETPPNEGRNFVSFNMDISSLGPENEFDWVEGGQGTWSGTGV